jgi:hypothetical protein
VESPNSRFGDGREEHRFVLRNVLAEPARGLGGGVRPAAQPRQTRGRCSGHEQRERQRGRHGPAPAGQPRGAEGREAGQRGQEREHEALEGLRVERQHGQVGQGVSEQHHRRPAPVELVELEVVVGNVQRAPLQPHGRPVLAGVPAGEGEWIQEAQAQQNQRHGDQRAGIQEAPPGPREVRDEHGR